jgi:hypothetical protein
VHNKTWTLERLRHLQTIHTVELCTYAILFSHYYHLLIRLNRQQALALATERLLSDPPRNVELSRGARQSVEHFDLQTSWRCSIRTSTLAST